MTLAPWQVRASPVTRVRFRGQRVHVKRDDVFHLAGNKMRKLYWFLQQNDAYYHDAHLVSFGGTQSNAMLAIAQLAHAKRVPFTYFSRALDVKLIAHSERHNLSLAKQLGMHHIEVSTDEYRELASSKDLTDVTKRFLPSTLTFLKPVYIPQGAAFSEAEDGLRVLAEELNEYCTASIDASAAYSEPRRFSVVVPCGTGTTAFYLAQHLHPRIRLLSVPCVGDHFYLQQQFQTLAAQHGARAMATPEVLAPTHKARFGRLSRPLLDVYHELLDATDIEFDLLYAAFAWQTLFDPQNLAAALDASPPRELLYVHTGGVSGNGSMLARYASQG